MHEAKLAKMEAEMKMVFQQKVQEKEAKLKQSEEELYARHREMKDALEKQRLELEDKKRRVVSGGPCFLSIHRGFGMLITAVVLDAVVSQEQGRPLTPEKSSVSRVPRRPSGRED